MEERRVAIYARPLFPFSECKIRAFYGFGGDKKFEFNVECWMLNVEFNVKCWMLNVEWG